MVETGSKVSAIGLALRIAGGVFLLFAILMAIVGFALHEFRRDSHALWDQVAIGESEESARSKLGPPFREYTRESAPADYYVSGYRKRERSISSRVLIYMGADLVLYIWIDENDRVEEMFRGVS